MNSLQSKKIKQVRNNNDCNCLGLVIAHMQALEVIDINNCVHFFIIGPYVAVKRKNYNDRYKKGYWFTWEILKKYFEKKMRSWKN